MVSPPLDNSPYDQSAESAMRLCGPKVKKGVTPVRSISSTNGSPLTALARRSGSGRRQYRGLADTLVICPFEFTSRLIT